MNEETQLARLATQVERLMDDKSGLQAEVSKLRSEADQNAGAMKILKWGAPVVVLLLCTMVGIETVWKIPKLRKDFGILLKENKIKISALIAKSEGLVTNTETLIETSDQTLEQVEKELSSIQASKAEINQSTHEIKETEATFKSSFTNSLNGADAIISDLRAKQKEAIVNSAHIARVLDFVTQLENELPKYGEENDPAAVITKTWNRTLTDRRMMLDNSWVKAGYYLPVGSDGLKLSVLYVHENEVTVQLASRSEQYPQRKLTPNESFDEKVGNDSYEITLNKIDSAGMNPFSKAGYFTVIRKQKHEEEE